jgi:hypothetical protein
MMRASRGDFGIFQLPIGFGLCFTSEVRWKSAGKEGFCRRFARHTKSKDLMGSVVKKRRKKIRKHKFKKLRKRMRHQRR